MEIWRKLFPSSTKERPACYGGMYELTEDEMAERCLSCPHFNDCKKLRPEELGAGPTIPQEADTDKEYKVKW